MDGHTAIAVALAAGSTTLTNLAYLREHDAAAALPALSMRRPLHSLGLLFGDRSWLVGFVLESSGFALYAAALALASLALVQSIAAGGIGVLAFFSSRRTGQSLGPWRRIGVLLSVLGLASLGVSLTGGSGQGGSGSTLAIGAWLGGCAVLAVVAVSVGRLRGGLAVAEGLAGGLLFSIGDFSTKVATQGGARVAFVITLIAGYALGTSLLQLGYQRGGALTVAGLATLLTNAMPIIAGTIILGEPVPGGLLGALRIIAFISVIAGAILLALADQRRPQGSAQTRSVGPIVAEAE